MEPEPSQRRANGEELHLSGTAWRRGTGHRMELSSWAARHLRYTIFVLCLASVLGRQSASSSRRELTADEEMHLRSIAERKSQVPRTSRRELRPGLLGSHTRPRTTNSGVNPVLASDRARLHTATEQAATMEGGQTTIPSRPPLQAGNSSDLRSSLAHAGSSGKKFSDALNLGALGKGVYFNYSDTQGKTWSLCQVTIACEPCPEDAIRDQIDYCVQTKWRQRLHCYAKDAGEELMYEACSPQGFLSATGPFAVFQVLADTFICARRCQFLSALPSLTVICGSV
mmetsp:Transcript_27207/g.42537  ORF Transcript_27207/g.42537 Transcript_27207/m.42537 type:complete len:284 (-) Transcript_27207:656-1507(-)